MHPNFTQVARDADTVEAALLELRALGASPILALRALHDAKGLGLVAAKTALHASPAWADVARAQEAMWSELQCEDGPGPDDEAS